MKRIKHHFYIIFIYLTVITFSSCFLFDYFSEYNDKNLIGQFDFTDWETDQGSTYMTWEEVSSTDAGGTTGLPDTSAMIYRLEMNNLVPDGDFENSATAADAGWTATGGSLNITYNSVFASRALSFTLGSGQYADYPFSKLADGATEDSSYLFRFDLTSTSTGTLTFLVDTTNGTEEYKPNIGIVNTIYQVPDDFQSDEVPDTEFAIADNTADYFEIKYDGGNTTGVIDNFRIVRTDQDHFTRLSIPYEDENRVDGLELIDGTYRFSIYVKADPGAGSGNSFPADAVTLQIESFDSVNPSSTTAKASFEADNYSGFSGWTELSIDLVMEISEPEDAGSTVIRLSVCPGDAISTSTLDACSILVSNPALYYSAYGSF